jgi:glycosyltransferase involved in cell wall biosynthesis
MIKCEGARVFCPQEPYLPQEYYYADRTGRPPVRECPPKLYGGTERVISYLTEELVRLGHEVTLFASGDSETNAKLVPACCRETLPHHVRLMDLVFQDASRFDIIHFHCDYLHFPLLRRYPCPSVTTLHGRLHVPDLQPLFAEFAEVPLVSISNDQRRPIPWANWQATVYHGLPRNLHTFQGRPGDYLAFLGRISPEKRLDRAIAIAHQAGKRLKVAAKIYPEERDYFNQTIKPLLHESRAWVELIGEVGGREKDEFLGNALALLFPIDWPEPFGLVMIEAMACGSPVIAWRNGSVPEVIEDGVTGFVVDSVEEAVQAVEHVATLSRHTCRSVFEERYDAARMARDYLEVYRHLVHAGSELARSAPHAAGPVMLPAGHSLDQRKPCRSRVPLLGAVPDIKSHDLEAVGTRAGTVQMLTGNR